MHLQFLYNFLQPLIYEQKKLDLCQNSHQEEESPSKSITVFQFDLTKRHIKNKGNVIHRNSPYSTKVFFVINLPVQRQSLTIFFLACHVLNFFKTSVVRLMGHHNTEQLILCLVICLYRINWMSYFNKQLPMFPALYLRKVVVSKCRNSISSCGYITQCSYYPISA